MLFANILSTYVYSKYDNFARFIRKNVGIYISLLRWTEENYDIIDK